MGFDSYSKTRKLWGILSLCFTTKWQKRMLAAYFTFYKLLLMNAILVFERYPLMFRGNTVNKGEASQRRSKHAGFISSISQAADKGWWSAFNLNTLLLSTRTALWARDQRVLSVTTLSSTTPTCLEFKRRRLRQSLSALLGATRPRTALASCSFPRFAPCLCFSEQTIFYSRHIFLLLEIPFRDLPYQWNFKDGFAAVL